MNKGMFLVTEEFLDEKHRHGVEFQQLFSVPFFKIHINIAFVSESETVPLLTNKIEVKI